LVECRNSKFGGYAMTNKEFSQEKKRIAKYLDKWHKTLGMGWWEVQIVNDRYYCQVDDHIKAETIADWGYKTAVITFYMPLTIKLSDQELEETIVHEYSHILTNPFYKSLPDEKDQNLVAICEYGTEMVKNALLWTRKAGKDDKPIDKNRPLH
jgi:hypothetical protein